MSDELVKRLRYYHLSDMQDWDLYLEAADLIEQQSARIAELETRAGEAIPQGWKLVPLEPSNKMTAVGQEHRYESVWSIGAIYREMIAHAPIPPTGDAAGKDSVDAARYRWIRDRSRSTMYDAGVDLNWYEPTVNLDGAIDCAIASLTKTADGEKNA